MSTELNQQLESSEVVWNLHDLYQGLEDPRISQDLESCAAEAETINTGYSGRIAILTAAELLLLVGSLESLETRLAQLATFAFLNFATQTGAPEAGAFLQKIKEFGSRINKSTLFFELEWCKVEAPPAEALLAAECLAEYRHYLQSLRRYSPHRLSHLEETLLVEKAPVGRGSWNLLFEKVMGQLKFGPQQRSTEVVLAELYHPERQTRAQAAADLTAGLNSNLHILSHIANTLLADKMIDDRLRHYPSWISAMNLANEVEDGMVATLVEAVVERYDIPQRYYRFKKELLGLPELFDYDRYAPVPNLPSQRLPWPQAREMVLAAFHDFSPEFEAIASQFFANHWIHAPLLNGKRGGAFAHPGVPHIHPYVMVNYTGNLRDVSTLAHELGHGVHQFLAAKRGYYNSETPLVLAETASVFAELLLFQHQLEQIAGQPQRQAFICQKLESIFATVFRQVAMNRFEEATHNARRQQGELAPTDFAGHWLASQQAMFGDSVTLTQDYGVWWSYIPHFLHSPGYVYSYAFGELLVLALYNLYQQDRAAFVPKYLELLMAGGSQSPSALVSHFGVDLHSKSFWSGGLQIIDDLLQMAAS